jgi:hypothetical protein
MFSSTTAVDNKNSGAVVAIHHRGVLVFAEVTHGTPKII